MELSYTVIKSARKGYSVRITTDNKITVRAPLNATDRQIKKFLAEKSGWINKVVAFNANNKLDNADVRDMKSAYVNGKLVPVICGGKNYIGEDGVHIANIKSFKTAYVNGAGGEFIARFKQTERECNLHAKSVNFRSYKGRWGCCDGENNIVFNYKLMMLPPGLQRYVMVHELCHTVYHNHSSAFWALVKRFVPDYNVLRKQLKDYNFLAKMY
ncbi:MAG: M48 family metallopeptidase [Clostridia bacterium]|nr:M48 family metallopeptidase [Clostridia bacterium]